MNTTMGCWSLQFASQGWNPAMPSNAASGAGTREKTLGGSASRRQPEINNGDFL